MCGLQRCVRVMHVNAKQDDRGGVSIPHLDLDHDGYVPHGLGIGGGDYLRFTVCLDCGKIQNWEPLSDDDVTESIQEA